nr:dna repair:transcription protein met18:mms19 [Hymenolepis microstoma]
MSELLYLVESLQESLTAPNDSQQKAAFQKLNAGIKSLSSAKFTEKEVFHVVDFYVSRLVHSDPNLIGILLEGLLWFADNHLLSAECAVKICNDGFYSTLSIQSLRKEERRIAFRLLLALLSSDRTISGLMSMKFGFVRGFIASVENEKDPECLMAVFSMHCIVLKHFNLAHLAEDHFDIMAAYFPVDYNPPVGSKLGITRAQLVDRLGTALFASRQIDGAFLLSLLLEKATSHRPEARADALALLADCVNGIHHVGSSFIDFRISTPSGTPAEDPIPISHVTAYLFALCNLIKQLTIEMDVSDDPEDIKQMLCFVAGLSAMYKGKPEELDFVETFLKCLWPEKSAKEGDKMKLDSWFSVPPDGAHALPTQAPDALVADCLLTAVLAAPGGHLLPRLFRRLATPLLWPRVTPLPTEDSFYRAKFEQIALWTPHLSFLNRLLFHISCYNSLSFEDLQLNKENICAIIYNLSNTLKAACCDLKMCEYKGDVKQGFTEVTAFSLLCRLLLLIEFDYEMERMEVGKAFIEFCPHIFEHMLSDWTKDPVLRALRSELQNVLANVMTQTCLVEDDLKLLLFKLLEDDSCMEYKDVAIEILQRAACGSNTILNNFLTLLFENCRDSISLTPIVHLVQAILFITKSLRQSDKNGALPLFASSLLDKVKDFIDFTTRLICDFDEKETKNCLIDLLFTLRLVSSSLSVEEHGEAFASFVEFTNTTQIANPYVALLLNNAIFSAIPPNLPNLPLNNVLNLLSNYFSIVISDHDSSTLKCIAFNELCVTVTAMINKFPNKEIPATLQAILDSLLMALKTDSAKSQTLLTSGFVVTILRGLLVSQLPLSPERQQFIDSLLNIILSSTIDYKTALQTTCLLHSIHLLLPLSENGLGAEIEYEEKTDIERMAMNEEVCHCLVNPLAVQKCFCLVGLRLRKAWKEMKSITNPSADQITLGEAFLQGYLHLVTLLPDDIVGIYASDALEAAVLGVLEETSCPIKQQTRVLSLKVIARMAAAAQRSSSSANTSTLLLPPIDAADDLLEKLTALRLTFTDSDSSHSTSNLRFNLARCLRFLVDLPPSVTSRHRNGVKRLLEDLLDDDCQSVRLEAARANNEWCIKV